MMSAQATAGKVLKRIVPMLDRLLVQKMQPLEKTAKGIYIPEKAQERLNRGRVIAVGPGTTEYKMQLKVGDNVVLPQYGGQEVKLDGAGTEFEGETLVLIKEEEILAKLQED